MISQHMIFSQHTALRFAVAAVAMTGLLFTPVVSSAQKGQPNAMQGFSQNRDKPIVVTAERMERRAKDNSVVLTGSAGGTVKVVQGDTTMRAKSLVVFTNAAPTPSGKAAPKAAMPGGGSEQISRIEARGDVTVMQKDQTVTGDTGIYDVRSGLITMSGNVLLTQEKNAARGDRLVVNINTGDSQLECNPGKSCVQMIINTESKGGAGAGPGGLLPGAAATPAPAAKNSKAKASEPIKLTPR
jgi:lipopolysaccharide export system protein LptA